MSTYNLSGSGVQSLSSGVGELDITITTLGNPARNGQANPTNRYDQGLLRLGNSFGYYPAIPVDADNMVLPVWPGVTRIGYALLHNCVISVAEVFGLSPYLGGGVASIGVPAPDVISAASLNCLGVELPAIGAAVPSTQNWGTANRTMLIPLRLAERYAVTRGWVFTGTTNSGNWDVGVYDSSMNLLGHTGSQSASASASILSAALSLTLNPGTYWLAMSADTSTAQYSATSLTSAPRPRAIGVRWATSNFPLANGATIDAAQSQAVVFYFGVARITP